MFKGQNALITGGSRGIGLAIATKLASQGASITLLARDEELLKNSLNQLPCDQNQNHSYKSFDLLSLVNSDVAIKMLKDGIESPTILINCAGITTHALLHQSNSEMIKNTIDLNLTVPIMLCQLFIKDMLRQKKLYPSILNISSVLSYTNHVIPGTSVYAASKAGLLGFTRSLSHELRGRIRVNAMLPGLVKETDMGSIVKSDLIPISLDCVATKAINILEDRSINGQSIADVIGVSPENQSLYESTIDENGTQIWHCLNDSSIILTYDQINDNYCDCPDGSDEPGTNACPKPPFKFYCANEGHFPGYIDQFKLNDGVCDYDICCDGSDEYKLGNCVNKCEEIHRQYEEYKNEQLAFIKKALEKKQKVIDSAQNKRKKLIDNLHQLKRQIPERKIQINKLKLQYENSELDQQDTSVFEGLKDHFNGLANKIEAHKRDILKQESKVSALENILEILSKNFNPNFNDPAVKDSIHKYQEYVSNKEEAILEDIHETNQMIHNLIEKAKTLSHNGAKGEDHLNYYPPTIYNLIHYYFQLFAKKFLKKPVIEYTSNLSQNELSYKIENLEKELEKIEQKIKVIKTNLSLNYGPDNILRAYDSITISKKLGGYNYRINLLDGIYQDDVFIGKFKEFKDDKLFYNNGDRCWNGPKRSATVEFICGEGPDLISVSEPEKCHYHFLLQGESWCHQITEDELKSKFKINYKLL
ncbi:uncharacterized protein KGF55_000261 [Candida pseudojiufengensis]|uniref:uncharacterized protein n=1 Tax=Candida pseudojiufengensis TaxID=497109 RepID=UPI0022245E8B|nr:uncharacterized protein KGF55_000261 [Candida pseudojiufengensis]KAI5966852.1 hypothetical protein KGF55_000261 [Candida pseudojiufengensis]